MQEDVRGRFKIKNTIICGKSQKGGEGGQGQNQKSLHFKCRVTLTGGGRSEFFRFFPNSNN